MSYDYEMDSISNQYKPSEVFAFQVTLACISIAFILPVLYFLT